MVMALAILADANVYDRAFATHMGAVFAADFVRSRPVTLAQWQAPMANPAYGLVLVAERNGNLTWERGR
jgi:phosphatidylserine/phosphatidylglycerophosphate/cardiolipin synthase-like enzyme